MESAQAPPSHEPPVPVWVVPSGGVEESSFDGITKDDESSLGRTSDESLPGTVVASLLGPASNMDVPGAGPPQAGVPIHSVPTIRTRNDLA
jgi:hypothetical protein